MRRSRLTAAFAAASAILLAASVLAAAAIGNRLDTVFGGLLKPIIVNELVAKVGKTKLYSRDVAMLRLLKKAGLSGEEGELEDGELLGQLIELTLLYEYANGSGMTYDESTFSETLKRVNEALETEEARKLVFEYKKRFARSDKGFDEDLRAALDRELKVRVLILALYYAAMAQGMLSEDLPESEAKEIVRDRLLSKLRAKTIIEVYE
ncbi:MAG TPA: hypothetical protein GXX22_01990 [Clostridiales bacterium]|nr:hypothetical protein [Clostridiales bacterium]